MADVIKTGEVFEGSSDIYDVAAGPFKLQLCADQFVPIADPARQRALFKRFVKRIVIETSSYCNRRCVFCPNADGNRLAPQRKMPPEMFETVIGDLAEIDFDGLILFHLYNEPLANQDIFDQIATARRLLPRAKLSFNSNGDYIKSDTVPRLIEAGLSFLHISIYGPAHGRFDRAYVEERVLEMCDKVKIDRDRLRWHGDDECRAIGVIDNNGTEFKIIIQAKDFNQSGYDRGGLVALPEAELPDRLAPCPSPFDEILLTWNGLAVPCCNIVGDNPDHLQYTVGKVTDPGGLFALYAQGPLVEWRRGLAKFAPHEGPCRACTRMIGKVQDIGEKEAAFNATMDFIMPDLPAKPAVVAE